MKAKQIKSRLEVAIMVVRRANPNMDIKRAEQIAHAMVSRVNQKTFENSAPDWTFDDSGINSNVTIHRNI